MELYILGNVSLKLSDYLHHSSTSRLVAKFLGWMKTPCSFELLCSFNLFLFFDFYFSTCGLFTSVSLKFKLSIIKWNCITLMHEECLLSFSLLLFTDQPTLSRNNAVFLPISFHFNIRIKMITS